MAEYIEREALIKQIVNTPSEAANKAFEQKEYSFNLTLDRIADRQHEIIGTIEDAPAADVVPVVHGRWEYNPPTINTYGQLRCSICNWWTLDPSVDCSYSYCPHCGAKMDGGADNA